MMAEMFLVLFFLNEPQFCDVRLHCQHEPIVVAAVSSGTYKINRTVLLFAKGEETESHVHFRSNFRARTRLKGFDEGFIEPYIKTNQFFLVRYPWRNFSNIFRARMMVEVNLEFRLTIDQKVNTYCIIEHACGCDAGVSKIHRSNQILLVHVCDLDRCGLHRNVCGGLEKAYFSSDVNRVSCSLCGFLSLIKHSICGIRSAACVMQSANDRNQSKKRQKYRRGGSVEHQLRPPRHRLLGSQIAPFSFSLPLPLFPIFFGCKFADRAFDAQ